MSDKTKCSHEGIGYVPELNKWRCISCGKSATLQYFNASQKATSVIDEILPYDTRENPVTKGEIDSLMEEMDSGHPVHDKQ